MWTRKLCIDQLNLLGKRVLIRVDYNVPMHNGKITNNRKVVAALDSIVYALIKEAKSVVIMTHLGTPKGIKNMKYSLAPVAEELNKLLRQVQEDPQGLGKYSQIFKQFVGLPKKPSVKFLPDCLGTEIEEVLRNPTPGSVFLLENLKFHVEENDYWFDTSGNKVEATAEAKKTFRQALCKLGDIYINDAFSLTHTNYSSVLGEGFDKRAAGFIIKKEMEHFRKALNKPKKPFLAILGGLKLADKVNLIDNLLDKVNEMIIAGAMAFPFLKMLKGMHTGLSLFDSEGAKTCKAIMKKARQKRVNIHFPVDFLASSRLGAVQIESIHSGIGEDWMALDVGPETCSVFRRIITRAKVILWNGPPGAYELENFKAGTESVLLDIVKATSRGATSIIVGHDTAACVDKWNQRENVSHVTSGTGAAKDILQGNILPGIAALSDYYEFEMNNSKQEYIKNK